MTLPLLKRATEDGVTFVLTPSRPASAPGPFAVPLAPAPRLPLRAPGPGEQYRFHFDMGKCIACKCCVVACNEQNGNPAAINWRRVGEIEGGWYPRTERSYLSMACNHCVNPTCLSGCPVDAFTKDPATGIVLHSADACIGCQYCTWNCSYGVPQYNPERGVVSKCDMCHGRLALGQSPACVSACPTGAIAVEIVKIDQWRAAAAVTTPAPGLPVGDESLSTTRITLPDTLPPNSRPVDLVRLATADPHWPLVVMTVFTQLSVGTFATIWLLQLLGASARLGAAALTSLRAGPVSVLRQRGADAHDGALPGKRGGVRAPAARASATAVSQRRARMCETRVSGGGAPRTVRNAGASASSGGAPRAVKMLKRALGLDTRPERYAYAVDPVMGYTAARTIPDRWVKTTCGCCSVGCGMFIGVKEGRAVSVRGDADHPVNGGALCPKGLSEHETLHASTRARYPLLRPSAISGRREPVERRRNRRLERVSWGRAIGTMAAKFLDVRRAYGPEAVGVISTGQLVTEEFYALGKLVQLGLGTRNYDGNTTLCMSAAVAGYKRSFGSDGPPGAYEDLERADVIVLVGANIADNHPILWQRIEANPGKTLIVVDPRVTKTAMLADLHLAVTPRSDLALINGLIHILIESDLIDREYIAAHTSGFDALSGSVREHTPERVSAGRLCDYSGMSYEAIEAHGGIQWPFPAGATGAAGTRRLYTDGWFQIDGGKARLIPVDWEPFPEQPTQDFPLALNTGRTVEHWHTRTKTGQVPILERLSPSPWLEMNPRDARALRLKWSDRVDVVSRRGRIRALEIRITETIAPGQVFVPFHWADFNANQVTQSAFDPISREPNYKQCAVRVERTA